MGTGKANLPLPHEVVISVKKQWLHLASKYSNDAGLIESLFLEIERSYTSAGRHYHNIRHIADLLYLSNQYHNFLKDKDTVDFSIFYHDFVYKVSRSDNENKSAFAAKTKLPLLTLPPDKVESVSNYITSTKSHQLSHQNTDSDLSWFLDFDMSILAVEWEKYFEYSQLIRKEYRLYPEFLYRQGRKKFLQKYLKAEFIFHTPLFRRYYEQQARENMLKELEELY